MINNSKMVVALVTGGMDPVHSGHIKIMEEAKKMSDKLIVGLNSDQWLVRKKGAAFMPWNERSTIVGSFRFVDDVIEFDDTDGSACDAILAVRKMYPDATILFCNGGDRTSDNIPEMRVSDPDVEFVFSVGGDNKANSSSWILAEWKAPRTDRVWGNYRVLFDEPGVKVKELSVEPGKSLSLQRHFQRSEYWLVSSGKCLVYTEDQFGHVYNTNLELFDEAFIPAGMWHQLKNPYDKECKIIEIQYGENCVEEDIERRLDK